MEKLPGHPDLAPRGTLAIVLALGGVLFGGVGLGILLAKWLVPQSPLADFIGFMVFPLCLGGGFAAWRTLMIATNLPGLLRILFTSRSKDELRDRLVANAPQMLSRAMKMAGVFVPISLGGGLLAGVLLSLAPTARSRPGVAALFTLAGLFYGLLLRALARRGYLPFPDEA